MTIVIAILGSNWQHFLRACITAIDDARLVKQKRNANLVLHVSDNIDVGAYPSTEEGLQALWRAPSQVTVNWDGPYTKTPITDDPWGNPYVYRYPGTHYGYDYDLMSYGKDGKLGGEKLDEDIHNWIDEETTQNQ